MYVFNKEEKQEELKKLFSEKYPEGDKVENLKKFVEDKYCFCEILGIYGNTNEFCRDFELSLEDFQKLNMPVWHNM